MAWITSSTLESLDTNVAPAALGASPPGFSTMDLKTYRSFAAQELEHFFLVVFRQRAGFAVPVANLQVINPSSDLRILAHAADAALIPIPNPPGLEPFLCRAGVFVNARGPFLGSGIGLNRQ